MVDEILAKKGGTTTPVSLTPTTLPSSSAITTTEKSLNGLKTRTQSDLERLNNNGIFDRGADDEDL